MRIPIIPRLIPSISPRQARRARALGRLVRRERPQLASNRDSLKRLQVDRSIGDDVTLHLDDFSEIPVIGSHDNSTVLQERAVLRGADGDFVALSNSIDADFANYAKSHLGLGKLNYLTPSPESGRPASNHGRQLALACWLDRKIRRDLIRAVRQHGLRYIHPHVSTLHVWELASYLHNATRRPISVVGPPPALARWANDKIEFSRTVHRLLGSEFLPHSESAYNFATLAKKIMRLAATNQRLGIKFPYGTGGTGNFLIEAIDIRGRSLSQIRDYLKVRLSNHRWPQTGRVLIDVWEQNVLCSPSVQTWIPPLGTGEPAIEGLFRQLVNGDRGEFAGSSPLQLPARLQQQIVDSSYQLTLAFQQLGYVGRCSFDLILIGDNLDDCRVEFIECNARWGGTSLPMTFMNRILQGRADNGWCVQKIVMPHLDNVTFCELRQRLGPDLFDSNNSRGEFVLFNPGRLKANSAIEAIAIADTTDNALRLMRHVLPARLRRVAAEPTPNASAFLRDSHSAISGVAELDNTTT